MHVQPHVRMQRAGRGDIMLTARRALAARRRLLSRAVGPGPPRRWVRPHRAWGRRRVTMAYMSFSDDMPAAEPEPRMHHPWDPPVAEFPAVVPSGPLVLGRTERAAVAITGISAYSAGFEIFVTARFRPGAGGGSGPG